MRHCGEAEDQEDVDGAMLGPMRSARMAPKRRCMRQRGSARAEQQVGRKGGVLDEGRLQYVFKTQRTE
jgi:hypothetical protein